MSLTPSWAFKWPSTWNWKDFWHAFEINTSPIDWCEPNYVHSRHIAEFYNVISNIFFFLYPPILMVLFQKSYARPLNSRGCHLPFLLLIVIGIGSCYYHATLSLAGQLLDEIGIFWVVIAVWSLYAPTSFYPVPITRSCMQAWCVVLVVVITSCSWLMPALNSLLLMCLGIPVTVIMVKQTRGMMLHRQALRSEENGIVNGYKLLGTWNARAYSLGIRCIWIWSLGVVCWVTDRLHCDFWIKHKFPYMHAMWHLCVGIAGYMCTVLLCFHHGTMELAPKKQVTLHMWPSDSWRIFGVPYVKIGSRVPTPSSTPPTSPGNRSRSRSPERSPSPDRQHMAEPQVVRPGQQSGQRRPPGSLGYQRPNTTPPRSPRLAHSSVGHDSCGEPRRQTNAQLREMEKTEKLKAFYNNVSYIELCEIL